MPEQGFNAGDLSTCTNMTLLHVVPTPEQAFNAGDPCSSTSPTVPLRPPA